MEFDDKNDRIILSTGKTGFCSDSRINPENDGELTYGFDDCVRWEDDAPLTQTERDEIGGHVIARWTKWMRNENG